MRKANTSKRSNHCGGCTLCCDLLAVPWMGSPAGEPCEFCTDAGCALWPDAPEKCRAFACAWRQVTAHEDLRPDNCGVLFEKVADTFMLGTVAHDFEMPLSPVLKGQVAAFLREGYSVVFATMPPTFVLAAHQSRDHLMSVLAQAREEALGNIRH